MATFSTNQVRHCYVAKDLNTSPATAGDIKFVGDATSKTIKAVYANGKGEVVSSDAFPVDAKITTQKSTKLARAKNRVTLTSPVVAAGQDYIITVSVPQYGCASSETTLEIVADYHAKTGDTASIICKGLAEALVKNMSKLPAQVCDVYIMKDSTEANDLLTTDSGYAAATAIGIALKEADPVWELGKIADSETTLQVSVAPIVSAGDSVSPFTIAYVASSSTLPNSKKIADLEYFCLGERGDVYRKMGWPNSFEAKCVADGTLANGYHVIEISYAHQGNAEDIQKSPVVITIPVPYGSATAYAQVNEIIGTASSSADPGTLNAAIYDAAGSAATYVAQLS